MTSIDRRLGCVRYHNPRENSRELPTRLPRENRRDVRGRRTPSRDAAARARPHDCHQIMPSTAPPRDADRVIVRVSAVDDANGGRGGGVARDAGGNPARTTNPWANEDAVVNVSLETPRREDGLGDAASASASAGGTRRKTSISSSDDPTPEWLKALAREDRPDARFKVPARWVTPFRGSMIWWLAPAFRFVQIVFAALAIAVVASMNSDASVAFPEARPRSFATSPARFLGFAPDAPTRRLYSTSDAFRLHTNVASIRVVERRPEASLPRLHVARVPRRRLRRVVGVGRPLRLRRRVLYTGPHTTASAW